MNKDSLICFRTSKELHESLVQVAKRERRSLSSIIEIILTNYLKEKTASPDVEKRQYQRKVVSVPAVINQQDPGQRGIGVITDISRGGAKVLIPKDFKHQTLIESKGSRFELVFNLSSENKPLRLSCESVRVLDAEENIHIGAAFVDANVESCKAIQTYLM